MQDFRKWCELKLLLQLLGRYRGPWQTQEIYQNLSYPYYQRKLSRLLLQVPQIIYP